MSITQISYEDFITGSNEGNIQVWRIADGVCKSKFSHFDKNNEEIEKSF